MPEPGFHILRHRAALGWVGGFALFAAFIVANLDLATFLQYLLLGLPQGAIIALIAVGYSMVYGIIQLINFAHGEVFMLSTYFMLMMIDPSMAMSTAGIVTISVFVGLLFACTAWTLLQRVPSRMARIGITTVVGLAAALLNSHLIPGAESQPSVPFFAAWAVAIVYSCCLGVSMDVLAYRPLRASPRLMPLITAIGLSIFFQNFAQVIWSSSSRYFPSAQSPALFIANPGEAGAGAGFFETILKEHRLVFSPRLDMSLLDFLIIVLTVLLMAGLQLFIHRTRTGKAMRACAQDRVTASLMGIRVNSVVALAFALGAGLAAVAAPLYVVRGTPSAPQMGYIVGILAFSSAVLGGIGNITGAMLGGMVIGVIYSFVPLLDAFDSFRLFGVLERVGWITREGYERFVGAFGRPGQYQLGVAYAFMILVIVFKPTGLLGRATARRA